MTQDGPRMPQDGPKMTPRWTQEATSWAEETKAPCTFCKIGYASSVFRSRNTELAQDRPGMTPRWPRAGPKMVPGQLQGDPKMVLSCRRSANFAKSAMPSSVLSPRGPKTAQSGPKRAQDEPGWSQDGPRWPKTGRRWPEDDAKIDSRGRKLGR